ncbi:amino acid/polyamine transporter I [Zopfochytrium polystomum]|nr:amino acid/polyamine transporter I [Zopfochytrium polystomum]
MSLFRPKPVGDWADDDEDLDDHGHQKAKYSKALTAFDLTAMGIGAIIGAGIFTLTGRVARAVAGPAVVISYLIAGVVCALSALCYAELSAMIPVSGSAYSYTYATLGEFVAWIIGWDLILEYMVGSASVAVGWGQYLGIFLNTASEGKITFDPTLSGAPVAWDEDKGQFYTTGNKFDIPAFVGTILITILLASGVKMSSVVVNILVVTKLVIVLMFIFGGIKYTNSANLTPFMPFGADGVFRGSITVFFAYIGFDAVSTTAQEAKNPQRDLPIGILSSLAICTVLYIAVCLVLATLLPYSQIPNEAAVANALIDAGGPKAFGGILAFGALAGLTSVMMVMMIGQPRIFRAMAHDGLFPESFAYIHPKTRTPIVTTVITGSVTAIASGFLPIDVLANLTSVGTLVAFLLAAVAVIVLRIREPERARPFAVPGGRIGGFVWPLLSIAAIIVVLIKGGTTQTLLRVVIWLAIGLVVYFSHGFWWSKHRHPEKWPVEAGGSIARAEGIEVVDKK